MGITSFAEGIITKGPERRQIGLHCGYITGTSRYGCRDVHVMDGAANLTSERGENPAALVDITGGEVRRGALGGSALKIMVSQDPLDLSGHRG